MFCVTCDIISGRGYFRRFKEFYPGVRLVSPCEVESAASMYIDPNEWAFDRDEFLWDGTPSRLCPSPKGIVLIESEEVTVPGTNISLNLMVTFQLVTSILTDS